MSSVPKIYFSINSVSLSDGTIQFNLTTHTRCDDDIYKDNTRYLSTFSFRTVFFFCFLFFCPFKRKVNVFVRYSEILQF